MQCHLILFVAPAAHRDLDQAMQERSQRLTEEREGEREESYKYDSKPFLVSLIVTLSHMTI